VSVSWLRRGRVPAPPPFTEGGDLPPGVHRATLRETLERFVESTSRSVPPAQIAGVGVTFVGVALVQYVNEAE